MSRLITLMLSISFVIISQSALFGYDNEYSGMISEIVVTAPRYLSEADMGMMPEVVVTAPRYGVNEENGLMPEIVVTAPRYKIPDMISALNRIFRRRDLMMSQLIVLKTIKKVSIIPNI